MNTMDPAISFLQDHPADIHPSIGYICLRTFTAATVTIKKKERAPKINQKQSV